MKAQIKLYQIIIQLQASLMAKTEFQNRQQCFQIINRNEDSTDVISDYYATVQRNVMITKIKIDQFLKRFIIGKEQMMAILEEKNALKILQRKIAVLDSKVENLMEDGILQLYMDLCELTEKIKKNTKIKPEIIQIITFIIQSLHNLLKNYFILYQFKNMQQSREKQQKKSSFSLKCLQINELKRQKVIEAKEQLKQIEDRVYSLRIDELMNEYVKNEEKSIKQREQICRICQNKFKMDYIGRHVKYCQNKCRMKNQIEIKKIQMVQTIELIKTQYQTLCEKESKNVLEENFKKVAKIILANDKKKSRKKIRRCSLTGVKSQKHIQDIYEQVIEEYQQQNGQHPQLHNLLDIHRDLIYLQKKLTNLQINYENQTLDSKNSQQNNNSQQSYKITIKQVSRSNRKLKEYGQAYKKSDRIISNISIRTNQLSLKEIIKKQSERSQSILNQFDLNKKSSDLFEKVEMNDLIKHYVSLQDIVHEENEEITISLDNFTVLKVLGQGAFGKVYLVKKKETDNLYAMKIVQMKEESSIKQFQTIKNEYEIFKQIGGDHLVSAPFSFSENQTQFFILEYLPGGDLRKILDEEVYFDEQKAKFYLAQIILAIEHLHKYSIIHRDLKPENLVFDRYGHLKLTDFGLSEQQIHKKITICSKLQEQQNITARRSRKRRTAIIHAKKRQNLIGTPDYIAPQIINHVSINNYTIDWWSLGVISYELLIGARPFTAQTVEEVINNIINLQLQWPEDGEEISPAAKDLIQKLLDRDFINRFGANGAAEIKKHEFFEGINWQNIKKEKPPAIPKVEQVQTLEENIQLTKEIETFIGRKQKTNTKITRKDGKKRTLKLEKFVRFDILGTETIENAEKVLHERQTRIQKLKYISKYNKSNSSLYLNKQI